MHEPTVAALRSLTEQFWPTGLPEEADLSWAGLRRSAELDAAAATALDDHDFPTVAKGEAFRVPMSSGSGMSGPLRGILATVVMENFGILTMKHPTDVSLDNALALIPDTLALMQALLAGDEIHVPATALLTGIALGEGTDEVVAPWGHVRRKFPWDMRHKDDDIDGRNLPQGIYQQLRDIVLHQTTCVLFSEVPLKGSLIEGELTWEGPPGSSPPEDLIGSPQGQRPQDRQLDQIRQVQLALLLTATGVRPSHTVDAFPFQIALASVPGVGRYGNYDRAYLNDHFSNAPFPGAQATGGPPVGIERAADTTRLLASLDRPEMRPMAPLLDRLLDAHARYRSPVDQLIDAVICWEGLFGGSSELVLRVSTAIAKLLVPDGGEPRADLASEARKIYTMRSRIVHGRGVKPTDLFGRVDRAKQLSREVLRTMLDRSDLMTLSSDERGLRLILD